MSNVNKGGGGGGGGSNDSCSGNSTNGGTSSGPNERVFVNIYDMVGYILKID